MGGKTSDRMAMSLLRTCSRAGISSSRSLLLPQQAQLLARPEICLPTLLSKKALTLSPSTCSVFDYFRARRGPFTPAEKKGNHMILASTHWKLERIVAISLLGTIPGALIAPGPVMDFLLATSFLLHSHWGIDAILQDYFAKFIPWIQKVGLGISVVAMAGLIHFNYNDIGVSRALLLLWSIQ